MKWHKSIMNWVNSWIGIHLNIYILYHIIKVFWKWYFDMLTMDKRVTCKIICAFGPNNLGGRKLGWIMILWHINFFLHSFNIFFTTFHSLLSFTNTKVHFLCDYFSSIICCHENACKCVKVLLKWNIMSEGCT